MDANTRTALLALAEQQGRRWSDLWAAVRSLRETAELPDQQAARRLPLVARRWAAWSATPEQVRTPGALDALAEQLLAVAFGA